MKAEAINYPRWRNKAMDNRFPVRGGDVVQVALHHIRRASLRLMA
jgi:hypothetical protein